MNLQTRVEIECSKYKIDYRTNMMMVGSCFADEIGALLKERHFPISVNPFGTLYNPASIVQSIERLTSATPFSKEDIFKSSGVYVTFSHHSQFADIDQESFLNKINSRLQIESERFKRAECIIITLGTSWVYRAINSGIIVSNCHKVDKKEFKREFLDQENIIALLNKMIQEHPEKKWIFTVSPIRHLKDGLHNNQLSKATLLLAINSITQKNPNCSYFPAYEIFLDELRDYRFYAEDMVHPSRQGVNYLWDRFKESFLTEESINIIKEVEKITRAQKHRPLFPESKEYQKFSAYIEKDIRIFKNKYPYIHID